MPPIKFMEYLKCLINFHFSSKFWGNKQDTKREQFQRKLLIFVCADERACGCLKPYVKCRAMKQKQLY